MMLLLKKLMAVLTVISLSFSVMAGCAKPGDSPGSASQGKTAVISKALAVSSALPASSTTQEDAQFLLNIQKYAQQGKTIDCEFPVQSTCIENVQEKWGKEDKSEYIASAKGTYASYSKKNIVFGFNKGSQIFEVRTFDSRLKQITFAKVKEVFGKPVHEVQSGNEKIIGYAVTKDYKILMAFPNYKSDGEKAKLDHYSVFYPQGTVNSMADDPGREW